MEQRDHHVHLNSTSNSNNTNTNTPPTAPNPSPSNPVQPAGRGRKARSRNWTIEEQLTLIEAKKLEYVSPFDRSDWVVEYLRDHGCQRTMDECEIKWTNMISMYKSVKKYAGSHGDSYWGLSREDRVCRNLPIVFDKVLFEKLDEWYGKNVDTLIGQQSIAAAAAAHSKDVYSVGVGLDEHQGLRVPSSNIPMLYPQMAFTLPGHGQKHMYQDIKRKRTERVDDGAASASEQYFHSLHGQGIPQGGSGQGLTEFERSLLDVFRDMSASFRTLAKSVKEVADAMNARSSSEL